MPSIQSCHLYSLAIYSYSDFGLLVQSIAPDAETFGIFHFTVSVCDILLALFPVLI